MNPQWRTYTVRALCRWAAFLADPDEFVEAKPFGTPNFHRPVHR